MKVSYKTFQGANVYLATVDEGEEYYLNNWHMGDLQ